MDVSRVEYLHFPEQGIVVAKIEGCAWDAVDEISLFSPDTTVQISWSRHHGNLKPQ